MQSSLQKMEVGSHCKLSLFVSPPFFGQVGSVGSLDSGRGLGGCDGLGAGGRGRFNVPSFPQIEIASRKQHM